MITPVYCASGFLTYTDMYHPVQYELWSDYIFSNDNVIQNERPYPSIPDP